MLLACCQDPHHYQHPTPWRPLICNTQKSQEQLVQREARWTCSTAVCSGLGVPFRSLVRCSEHREQPHPAHCTQGQVMAFTYLSQAVFRVLLHAIFISQSYMTEVARGFSPSRYVALIVNAWWLWWTFPYSLMSRRSLFLYINGKTIFNNKENWIHSEFHFMPVFFFSQY